MNNKVVLAAIMAMSLPLTDAAFGQGGAPGNPPARNEQAPGGGQGRQPPQQQRAGPGQGRDQVKPPSPAASRDHQPPPRSAPTGRNTRGAGPRHDIYRGERLPSKYRGKGNVMHNWQGHHLSPPPRGYHWVQTGPDFVLIATKSGIIARIVLSH